MKKSPPILMTSITKPVHGHEREETAFKENDGGCSRQSKDTICTLKNEILQNRVSLTPFYSPQDAKACNMQGNSQVNQQGECGWFTGIVSGRRGSGRQKDKWHAASSCVLVPNAFSCLEMTEITVQRENVREVMMPVKSGVSEGMSGRPGTLPSRNHSDLT